MSDLGYLALWLGLLAVYLVAMAAVLFGGAGTLAVPMFWAYLALFAILCLGASAAVYLLSPDLVRERVRPARASRTEFTVRTNDRHFVNVENETWPPRLPGMGQGTTSGPDDGARAPAMAAR